MARLDGKTIVVVGGATGIGAGAVAKFVAEGAKVVLGDINIDRASALASQLGPAVVAQYCDLKDEASMRDIVQTAVTAFGGLNGAFFNGADTRAETLARDTDVVSIDLDVVDHIMSTNFRGFLLGARFAIPEMIKAGGGSIVCTSSDWSFAPDGTCPIYGMSKAAVNALVRHIATRFGRDSIRCNGVSPGYVSTETAAKYVTPEMNARLLASVCGTRVGAPEDIGNMAAYLLSDEAGYVTGQIINVNGGSLLR